MDSYHFWIKNLTTRSYHSKTTSFYNCTFVIMWIVWDLKIYISSKDFEYHTTTSDPKINSFSKNRFPIRRSWKRVIITFNEEICILFTLHCVYVVCRYPGVPSKTICTTVHQDLRLLHGLKIHNAQFVEPYSFYKMRNAMVLNVY